MLRQERLVVSSDRLHAVSVGQPSRSAMRANLLDFDLDGLTAYCEGLGEKRFRAVQLFRWIHQKGASDFEQMSDLARSLRSKLAAVAEIKPLPLLSEHISSDGTVKWLFDVGAGNAVETVYIPEADRGTLCVSSQVASPRIGGATRAPRGQPGLLRHRRHCPASPAGECRADPGRLPPVFALGQWVFRRWPAHD